MVPIDEDIFCNWMATDVEERKCEFLIQSNKRRRVEKDTNSEPTLAHLNRASSHIKSIALSDKSKFKKSASENICASIDIRKIAVEVSNFCIFVLSSILQLLILVVLIGSIGFALYSLKIDIGQKIVYRRSILEAQISNAKQHYLVNRCHPDTRVPALQSQCAIWEADMRKTLLAVEICRIIAEVVADFIDGFIKKLSYQTIGTLCGALSIYMIFKKR